MHGTCDLEIGHASDCQGYHKKEVKPSESIMTDQLNLALFE